MIVVADPRQVDFLASTHAVCRALSIIGLDQTLSRYAALEPALAL